MYNSRTILALSFLGLLFATVTGCAGDDATKGTGGAHEACGSEGECAEGQVCGANNGACFGGVRSERRCWPASCEGGAVEPDCGEPTSPCGANCGCAVACDVSDPNSSCPAGEQCIYNFGRLFRVPSRDACGDPARCPSNDPAYCGDYSKLCGALCICTPDCSQATPTKHDDGCGGLCPGVCPTGLKGCCTQGIECMGGNQCFLDPDGVRTCHPTECANRALTPPLCGTPDALCGPECPVCTPQCGTMVCGPDPNCGMSCGTCDAGYYCSGAGQCLPMGL